MLVFDRFSSSVSSVRACSQVGALRLWSGLGVIGTALLLAVALAHAADEAGEETKAGRSSVRPVPEAVEIPTPTLLVYKTPTCGCCGKWIEHLEEAGFRVEAQNLSDLTRLKALNGVPPNLTSCHTALVEGYVIEGHVPASDIRKLLSQRPEVAGLAVPAMPLGSPGMEHPDPTRHEAYDVLAFGAGGVEVFSRHEP